MTYIRSVISRDELFNKEIQYINIIGLILLTKPPCVYPITPKIREGVENKTDLSNMEKSLKEMGRERKKAMEKSF